MPEASNIKTKFKGNFDTATSYVAGELVKHLETFWEAQWPVAPATGALTFPSFASTSKIQESHYDAGANSYPTIVFAIRGDYNLDVTTDHILVRAPTSQYNGSAPNDKLVLNWNEFSQNYPTGILPWGSTGPGVAAFEGSKIIAAKIDAVLYVDNLIRVPNVGDSLSSSAALGEVAYIRIENVSQAVIYMKDVSGQFSATDEIFLNAVSCGTYTLIQPEGGASTFAGWWKIDGFTPFTTTPVSYTHLTLPTSDLV